MVSTYQHINSIKRETRNVLAAAGLTFALSTALAGFTAIPAFAHEAKCPYCKLDVVQDTKEQDNEVALKYGRKRIEYRCVFCAIAQAKSEFKNGDVTILAPSEVKGKPIVITRKEGKWSAQPEKPIFVAEKLNHKHCQIGYRAFTNKESFEKWVHANHEKLKDAKPKNLDELVEVAK